MESSKAFAFVFALVITLGAMKFLGNFQFENVEAPVDDTPPPAHEEVVFEKRELLDSTFEVPTKPFSQETYSKYPRILVHGLFDSASLKIKGKNESNARVFLLLNIGSHTGIVNGVRKSASRIDMDATTELGGVFVGDIEASVDLFSTELGTNSKLFSATGLGKQKYSFIQSTQMPQVYPIMALPFNEKGTYTGVITSLEVSYSCSKKDACSVIKCQEGEKDSACILRELGEVEMNDWLTRNNLN